jgi:outer membrane protein assembly factor BamD (BamD/ComL family)
MNLKHFSFAILFILKLCAPAAHAADYIHGATVRSAVMYLSPDTGSDKLGDVGRGREVIILEKSRNWLHVQANVASKPYEERIVSGWILDKGVLLTTNPDAAKILYGEAIDSEDEASRRRGRKGADLDAMRLYYRVYEMFPASPQAGEALYRAADIRWQLEKADIYSKPSAKQQDAYLRGEIDPEWMKLVMKKFPGTKWADLAAFHLIDNKVCGDWQGASKCPEKEADLYEKYANEHPQSPKAAEALYNAAWRYSALIQIYKTEENPKKSDEAKSKAVSLAQKVVSQFGDSDWGARAVRLAFLVQQDLATYGNATE